MGIWQKRRWIRKFYQLLFVEITENKRIFSVVLFCCCSTWAIWEYIRSESVRDLIWAKSWRRLSAQRPFWAAARVRRTSVFTADENLSAGGIHFRRALKYWRVEAASGGRNPKRKTWPKVMSFFLAYHDNIDISECCDINSGSEMSDAIWFFLSKSTIYIPV